MSAIEASVTVTSDDVDNEICAGQSITFTAHPTNGGTSPTYQWKINGDEISGETNLTFTPQNLGNDDVVKVEMTSNATPCLTESVVSSEDLTIKVNSNPIIDSISGITKLCSASITNLSNPANADDAFTEVWTSSDLNIATVSTYGVVNKISNGSVTISYRATDINGCYADTSTIVTFASPTLPPDTVYGIKEVCSYINQTSSITYHVKPVAGATGYHWYLPTGINEISTSDRYIVGQTGSDSLVVKFDSTFYTYGAIYVSSVNASGCNSEWIPLWITKTTPKLNNITGPSNVCFANNLDTVFTYSVTPSVNGTSVSKYNWVLPVGASFLSNDSTNGTVNVKFNKALLPSNSYIKVSAFSNCGTSAQKSFRLTKLVSATPGVISGPTNPCIYMGTGDSATYTIRKIDGAASYNWTLPTGASESHPAGFGENDTIIRVTYSSSFTTPATIGVQSVGCNVSAMRSLSISKANPSAPTVLSGLANVCSKFSSSSAALSDTVIYRTKSVPNATGYTWSIPTNVESTSNLTNGDTFIVVRFRSAFTIGAITVKATSPCGESSAKSITINKLKTSTPGTIQKSFVPSVAAITNVSGLSTDTLRIKTVAYATSYYWRMSSGNTAITIEKLNASGLEVNDTAVVLHFPTGFTKDTVAVSAVNSCNISTAKTLVLSALAIPPTPNAIVDTAGNRTPCIGDTLPYRATAPAYSTTQAPVYRFRWTLPTGSVIVSSNLDSSLVMIKYFNSFAGGNISVKSMSAVGVFSTAVYSITLKYALATPTKILGDSVACIGSTTSFSVVMPVLSVSQRAAAVYRWTIPLNTTISSANPDSSTIMLTYNTGFTGGSLTVKGQSECGIQSTAKTQVLVFKLPATPAGITGSLAGCIGGSVIYTVTPGSTTSSLSATSGYRWTIPANTVIASAITDSSQITLQFNTGYTSGSLSARSQSSCGAISAAKSISLTAPSAAPTPASISTTSGYNACIGASKTFTAATTASPTGTQMAAVKYRWTIPAGTSIASASSVNNVDSASIVLEFNAGYAGGVLTVKGVTACGGVGAAKSQTLTHTGCTTGTGAIFTKTTQVNTDMKTFEAIVYPNPTTTDFRISLNSSVVNNEKTGVKIFDLQGRMIQFTEFTSQKNISFGNNLKPGIYMVHITQGNETQTKRVVKY